MCEFSWASMLEETAHLEPELSPVWEKEETSEILRISSPSYPLKHSETARGPAH